MIFLYPALVSGTVEPKILPAIAKSLEKYFLLQIQEGLTSGTIRVKAEWDGKRYSELQLESKVVDGGSVLLEASVNSRLHDLREEKKQLLDAISYNNNQLQIITQKPQTGPPDPSIDMLYYDPSSKSIRSKAPATYAAIHQFNSAMQDRINKIEDDISVLEPSADDKDEKSKTEKEKFEYQKQKDAKEEQKEKEAGEKSKYKTHGSYKVSQSMGVDLQPTMGNVEVRIRYSGGPASGSVGLEKVGDRLTIAVGTQILPMILKDFDSLQEVLLDDYFSNHFKTLFKSFSRTALRKMVGFVERQYIRLLGKELIPVTNGKSQVYKDVLLAPHGFVDASTFRKKGDAPKFYSYTSAVVVFNKSDITHPDEENFFMNQAQVQRMFKMGWNSFCIIDREREEMIFVTMLDGGSIHRIPFSYLYHSMNASDLYKDLDPLRKKVSAFFLKAPGSIKSLGSILAKENKLYRAVRNHLMG